MIFAWKYNILEVSIATFCVLLASVTTSQFGDRSYIFTGGQNKCFGNLGCISNGPPFYDPVHRPFLPLPEDGITTLFLLFNRPNINSFTYLQSTEDSLQNSTFNTALETKVIVHGYINHFSLNSSLMDLKNVLLNYENYNVIVVNWTQSSARLYNQAVSNGRIVGAQIARLLQFLHENATVPLETFHLIGHSLGAHVCGWAGERLTNIGRISGLDPAGPYFHDASDLVRLDITDALFVDIIHTNGGDNILQGLGIGKPIGHIDFFPNGGSLQPGCHLLGRAVEDQDITLRWDFQTPSSESCSHSRAVDLFTESVNNTACSFTALACDNWEKYLNGSCDQTYRHYRDRYSAKMGFHALKVENVTISRRFYLKTNAKPPYCITK